MSPQKEEFPVELAASIRNIADAEGYVTYKIDHQFASSKGVGYLGKPFVVTIKGKTKTGDKVTNIYVKGIISCEKIEHMLDVPGAFEAEAFVYNELANVFTELQNEAGIPSDERFKMIKSYGVSNSKGIFLENVAIQGYAAPARLYAMDLNFAELAIKELAKFHALAFTVKEKRPDFYKLKIARIKIPFTFTNEWKSSFLKVADTALKHLNEETRARAESKASALVDKYMSYMQEVPRNHCLSHGDFRIHNFLIKQKGDEIKDLYVVDYQLINVSSPIHDLLFFLMTGTEQDFRAQYLEHLKNHYYECFGEFLEKFDLEPEKVYPRKEYEKDFKERLDYGLICSLYFLPFILAAEDDIPDLSDESTFEGDIKVHESFPQRMQGLVDDYIDWGYL